MKTYLLFELIILKPMLETQYKFNKIYLLILTLKSSKKTRFNIKIIDKNAS